MKFLTHCNTDGQNKCSLTIKDQVLDGLKLSFETLLVPNIGLVISKTSLGILVLGHLNQSKKMLCCNLSQNLGLILSLFKLINS